MIVWINLKHIFNTHFHRIVELKGTLRSSALAFSTSGKQAEGREDSFEQQGQNWAMGAFSGSSSPRFWYSSLPPSTWAEDGRDQSLAVREHMVDFNGTPSTFCSLNNRRSLKWKLKINELRWELSGEKTDDIIEQSCAEWLPQKLRMRLA